jgi:hypothetical protein
MGIESYIVVWRDEEKRKCKEIVLGVEQKKREGRAFSGPWFPLTRLYFCP